MNAQQIIKMINEINGFESHVGMLPENKVLLDEIFKAARDVVPTDKTEFCSSWSFWLWTDKGSFEEFSNIFKSDFSYYKSSEIYEVNFLRKKEWIVDYEKMKEQWPVYFPDDIVWFKLELVETDKHRRYLKLQKRYIVDEEKKLLGEMDMAPLLQWILEAERKCIAMIRENCYTDYISAHLPYRHRSGVTTMSTFWKYVPEDKERIFGKINPEELKELQEWDEKEDIGWEKMTSNDYFNICNHLYDLLDLKTKYP